MPESSSIALHTRTEHVVRVGKVIDAFTYILNFDEDRGELISTWDVFPLTTFIGLLSSTEKSPVSTRQPAERCWHRAYRVGRCCFSAGRAAYIKEARYLCKKQIKFVVFCISKVDR